jgi:acyl-CoA reductase-like NAD-dependent aldehyde dehydrogenase
VIPVIPFDDDDAAVRMANDTWGGLCGSVWSADTDAAARRALLSRRSRS